jgi:Mg-chelatase subunit ChlD
MKHSVSPLTDVIDKFSMANSAGHSAFWRRDTSTTETLELAKLLVGLRKVSSFIGRNLGDIVWSGMDLKHGIALDPGIVMGNYPVPASKTDIATGLTARFALEKTQWSDRVKEIAQAEAADLSPPYAYKFKHYIDICEKVYLDCSANRNVFGLYAEAARQWEQTEKARQFLQPPTATHLFHIWWKMAADRSGEEYKKTYIDRTVGSIAGKVDLTEIYGPPIALLNSIVPQLINDCIKIAGVTERVDFRLKLYISIWPQLLEYIKFWPTDRSDPFLVPESFRKEMEKEDKEKDAVRATIISFADQIESAIYKKQRDFTEDVRANVSNVDDVVEIVGNDIVMRARDRIDKTLLHNLQQTIRLAAQRKTNYTRGLTSGKIDRRKLYRAKTTGQAFLIKKNEFELHNDVVLIVDATGSMSDPNKWDQAQVILQTLFSAIRKYNKNAKMFAYNEVKDKCRLTEIYFGGKFFTVLPHGGTASGEAIIATALKLRHRNKTPFIIHITDGASNWGCGVKDAIGFCRKKKINLLTLGIGCSPSAKTSLKDEYGKLVQFVDHTDDLPLLFGRQLRDSM